MTYQAQSGLPVHLSGEVWSTGSLTGLNDDNDVAVYIPTSEYQYAHVMIYYDGTGTATNSYTQLHNSSGSRVSCEYVFRGYDSSSNALNYQGGGAWQLYAQSQDCNVGWTLNAIIPVGSRNRTQIQIDMVYTRSGIGVARVYGGLSRPAADTIERIGVNIDGGGVVDFMEWKVIGYK